MNSCDVYVAERPCGVYEPSSPDKHGHMVVYLHDVDQVALDERPKMCGSLDRHGLRAVCPRVGCSWWTDRIWREFDPGVSPERHVVEHVVPYASDRWLASPPRIALLGVGMGGQGALKLAYKYPDLFPVVAAISPAIDYHMLVEEGEESLCQMYRDAEEARQDTATLHIHPLNWPRHQWFCCSPDDSRWFDSADRLRMKLYSLGVPHECDLETSTGDCMHDYHEQMANAAVEFIASRLEQERLRAN